MSWYAEIHGEIVTSRKAYPMVLRGIGPWLTTSRYGGSVEACRNHGRLVLRFGNIYRNLGGRFPAMIRRIARKFPRETAGAFSITSIDGCFFAATYRVEGGRLYRKALAQTEEEWRPENLKAPRGARKDADR